MKPSKVLEEIKKFPDRNFFILCNDQLGMTQLVPQALQKGFSSLDVVVVNAKGLTIERARQMEEEARLSPRGDSGRTHVFIYGMSQIPTGSVGALLKIVEESPTTRFVFQGQSPMYKDRTIRSRCVVLKVPFLSKKAVLANVQAMGLDALKVDDLGLWDGTLQGTLSKLQSHSTLASFSRELALGSKGFLNMTNPEMLQSTVFDMALADVFSEDEKRFIKQNPSLQRKTLALFTALGRGHG